MSNVAPSESSQDFRLETDADWLKFSNQLVEEVENIIARGETAPVEEKSEQSPPPPEQDEAIFEKLGVVDLKDVPIEPPVEKPSPEPDEQERMLRQVAQNALYLQLLARTNPQAFWSTFRAVDPEAAERVLSVARGESPPAEQATPQARAVQPSPQAMELIRKFIEHYQQAHVGDEEEQKQLAELDKIEDPIDRLDAKLKYAVERDLQRQRQQQLRDAVILQALNELYKKGDERFNEALQITQRRELANKLAEASRSLRAYADVWEQKRQSELMDLDRKVRTWLERAGFDVNDDIRREAVMTAIRRVLEKDFSHVVRNYEEAIKSLDDKRIGEARRSVEKALVSAIGRVQGRLGPHSAGSRLTEQQTKPTPSAEEKLMEEARRAIRTADELGIRFI